MSKFDLQLLQDVEHKFLVSGPEAQDQRLHLSMGKIIWVEIETTGLSIGTKFSDVQCPIAASTFPRREPQHPPYSLSFGDLYKILTV